MQSARRSAKRPGVSQVSLTVRCFSGRSVCSVSVGALKVRLPCRDCRLWASWETCGLSRDSERVLHRKMVPFLHSSTPVWCLAIGWCFVAPKTAWSKARRGSIAAALCDRGATKPQAVFGATLRAVVLFASRFVAHSSQTAEGYACRSRLAGDENSLRRNTSQLRDTTLAEKAASAFLCPGGTS